MVQLIYGKIGQTSISLHKTHLLYQEVFGRNCPSKGVHHLGEWYYAIHTQLRHRQWSIIPWK